MKSFLPKCTVKGGELTINIIDVNDSIKPKKWLEYVLKFRMKITMPINYVNSKVTITSRIQDGITNIVYAT